MQSLQNYNTGVCFSLGKDDKRIKKAETLEALSR